MRDEGTRGADVEALDLSPGIDAIRPALLRRLLWPLQFQRGELPWIVQILERAELPERRHPMLAAWARRWQLTVDDGRGELPIVHARLISEEAEARPKQRMVDASDDRPRVRAPPRDVAPVADAPVRDHARPTGPAVTADHRTPTPTPAATTTPPRAASIHASTPTSATHERAAPRPVAHAAATPTDAAPARVPARAPEVSQDQDTLPHARPAHAAAGDGASTTAPPAATVPSATRSAATPRPATTPEQQRPQGVGSLPPAVDVRVPARAPAVDDPPALPHLAAPASDRPTTAAIDRPREARAATSRPAEASTAPARHLAVDASPRAAVDTPARRASAPDEPKSSGRRLVHARRVAPTPPEVALTYPGHETGSTGTRPTLPDTGRHAAAAQATAPSGRRGPAVVATPRPRVTGRREDATEDSLPHVHPRDPSAPARPAASTRPRVTPRAEPRADAGAPGPASELPHDRPPAASPHAAHAAAVALSQRSFDPARPIPGTYETPPAPVGPTKPLEPRVDVDALVRQVERRLARELRWERELRRVSR